VTDQSKTRTPTKSAAERLAPLLTILNGLATKPDTTALDEIIADYDAWPRLEARPFLTDEYHSLRSTTDAAITRIENDQRNVLILSAAFWSWFATHQTDVTTVVEHINAIYYGPALVACLLFCRSFALEQVVGQVANYLVTVETLVSGLPAQLGWERSFKKRRSWFPWLNYVVWTALLVANALLGWIFAHPSHKCCTAWQSC
jgi:hypothetical protein